MNPPEIKINATNDSDLVLLKSFLSNTLKELMSILKAECGSLFVFDSNLNELVLDSFYNSGSLRLEGLKQRIGEGVSGRVVAINAPILVKDINNDPRFRRNGFTHYSTNSFISIPFFTSRGLLGVINLADKNSGEAFSEKDLAFSVAIAKYACLIVENFNICGKLRQEKETLNKQKSLLEQYASVGKLAAGVVHEINNPLDGTIRYSNILLDQLKDYSIAREYLLELKKGLHRIANITKSLLEFSHQISSTKTKKYSDLHDLLDDSLDISCQNKNAKIVLEKNYCDKLLRVLDLGLSHVFTNLINNAFDAMPEGGKLKVATQLTDNDILIIFKDTGQGIPAHIKEHIFDPFFTTKSIEKGTGLGLAICSEIISKYEGKIIVHSLSQEGSEFKIIIPKKFLENA